jgi:hypothetical protein
MERSWATAAENRPVYSVPVHAQRYMDSDTRTHEKEDSFGIVLPLVDHLFVFNICSLRVYGEERAGAVTEVGFSLQ